jgi:VanZ family protein
MALVRFRWLPVIVWAAVIFAFSSVPSLSSGLGTWDLVLRKCAHMTEYAILAALLWRALRSYRWAFVVAVAYACTDEFHQSFVRGRHATPVDVCIDAAGALVGLVLVSKLSTWSTGKSPTASSRRSSRDSTVSSKSSRV